MLIHFLMLVIATEAVTEIVTKSNIFIPFRRFFFKRRKNILMGFINDLLECAYCTSVWVAMIIALLANLPGFKFIILGFVVHRMANVTHYLIDRLNVNYASLHEDV